MSQVSKIVGFIVQAVIAGLALAFLLVYLWPGVAQRLSVQNEPPPEVPSAPSSYADAVNRTAPAVVSLYTRSMLPQAVDPQTQQRLGNRRLYRMSNGQGSGVLMSEDGYILTNHHVIAQVQNIQVALWDGRVAPARVIGSDPATDLAVLKIQIAGLPIAHTTENTEVHVGDVVLAIGNAVGLTHTVTMGVVSATGRSVLRLPLFDDFIQTDAAINPGNSGGALINSRGDLIGINTRNLDSVQGAQNIGFAIPIGLARNVMAQIIDYGSVQRGWIGAEFSNLRPTRLPDGSLVVRGVAVVEVTKDGPAWSAGLRPGDIILALNGEPVADKTDFAFSIAQHEPGSRVELTVTRGDETFETYATLLQQPPPQ